MKVYLLGLILSLIAVHAVAQTSAGVKQGDPSPSSSPKAESAKKLEFEDQAVNALDPDYGKLDLTSVKDQNGGSGRLYPVRKDFKVEQSETVKNWGISE